MAHQAEAYPDFTGMKRLGLFLLPPGWNASPSQGSPSIKYAGTHHAFMHLGGERHCESEVSCPRAQHNVPGKGSNPERSNQERTNHVVVAAIGLSV